MSKKLRNSARGQDCHLQIYPYCNGNPETTVLCHFPVDAGMGQKEDDHIAAFGCNRCHDVIDGRLQTDIDPVEIEKIKLRALKRTWAHWIDTGLIVIE